MTDEQFWSIIHDSRTAFDPSHRDGNMHKQKERLAMLLSSLTLDDIVGFDTLFQEKKKELYRWDLWAAAYIFDGGCSDDGFSDFREWLISMGEEVYTRALKDVNSLIGVMDRDDVEYPSFEGFWHVPTVVYEKKTGKKMPYILSPTRLGEPVGQDWTEKDLPLRFPELWAQYGSR